MTLHLTAQILPTTIIWIHQHATIATGSFEMLACFHVYVFWKTVSDCDVGDKQSQKDESQRKVTVEWRFNWVAVFRLIKESSGQTAADKVGHIPQWVPWLSSNHLLCEATCSPFSLCLFLLSGFAPLPFRLYFPIFIPFYSTKFLCPFSLLAMSVQEGRSCSDRQEERAKKSGREMVSCWALYVLRALSAIGNMSLRAPTLPPPLFT